MTRLFDYVRLVDLSLPDMPVIVADEIARQIDELPGDPFDPDHSFSAESYGCVAPPFETFFVEARTEVDGTPILRGCVVTQMQTYENVLQRALPDSKWVLLFTCWLRIDGSLMPFAGAPILHLDERGRILDDTRRIETVYVADTPGMLPAFGATNHLPFVLKAISAMHNRVEAEKVTPTRQQRRAYQREHKTERSPTDYWVLKVKKYTPQTIEEVGQSDKGKRPHREHQVRGHFRYYTEERPLFGRYSGMVWVPDHERGSDDVGHIRKDYEVG